MEDHPSSSADSSIPKLSPDQQRLWTGILNDLNQNNILCHCRHCDREWVSSAPEPCICGSSAVECLSCWQFPDD
ncbi:MAG: hypothetical protein ACO3EZ_03030 [Prochlorotrichaceae cyanobacterium]